MRHIIISLLCLFLVSPAYANSEGKKKNKGPANRIKAEWTIKNDVLPQTGSAPKDQDEALRSVDIPVVVVPISVRGHLVNYAFLNIRVVLKKDVDVWKMRVKSHFMRDAIIRTAHSHPFGKEGERSVLDQEEAVKRIRAALAPWVSDKQLDHIALMSVDMLNG